MAYHGTGEYLRMVARAVRDTFRFSGRATRTQMVVYYLATLLLWQLGKVGLGLWLEYDQADLASQALWLALILPIPALLVRRFHDNGRSGHWLWLAVFSFALWTVRWTVSYKLGTQARIDLDSTIWPLDWLATLANIATVALIVMPGNSGANRYGANPR